MDLRHCSAGSASFTTPIFVLVRAPEVRGGVLLGLFVVQFLPLLALRVESPLGLVTGDRTHPAAHFGVLANPAPITRLNHR